MRMKPNPSRRASGYGVKLPGSISEPPGPPAKNAPLPRTMNEPDLRRAICSIDDAIKTFRGYDGRLNPRQIRALSMLTVIQREVTDELLKEISAAAERQVARELNSGGEIPQI
jgi:hypothetical protein